jgi:predicted nucleic acid-binding protein
VVRTDVVRCIARVVCRPGSADTWIAACCIESGLPLVTLNRRDFADFAAYDGLVIL